MPRAMAIALTAAISALSAAACGSSNYLHYRVSDAVVPIVNGEDPGRAVGQCLRVASGGPVTTRCPSGVDRFFGKPEVHRMDRPGSYAHGIFARGGLQHPVDETVVAYEMLTYTSRAVTWRKSIGERDLPAARALCEDPAVAKTPVIVRAFEGCAINLSGSHRDAWGWTMTDLSHKGAHVGQPEGFWAQTPDRDDRPDKPRCRALRVVQAEVQTIGQICASYRADLDPPRDPRAPKRQTAQPPSAPPATGPAAAERAASRDPGLLVRFDDRGEPVKGLDAPRGPKP